MPFGDLVLHRAVVEEIAQRAGLDREIDVLRDASRGPRDPDRVELRGHDADHTAAEIEQRPAAVAGLHRSADLQETGVVEDAAQRRDDARGHGEI
jgi:hypothetical protein